MTPRTSSRADRGPAFPSLGRAAPNPERAGDRAHSFLLVETPRASASTTAGASASAGFSEYQQGFASNG